MFNFLQLYTYLQFYNKQMIVNEIFYSLQGEGFFTGTPSLFIRFSGCNLQCSFCDTKHQKGLKMTEEEIAAKAAQCPAKHVVITGGEPSLQLTASLVELLHQQDKFVAVETNGTHPLPTNVDWITLSPKSPFIHTDKAKVCLKKCNELKVVYTGQPLSDFSYIKSDNYFLQPCETEDTEQNKRILKETIAYCLSHPQWRLSLQTHKLIGVR